MRQEILARLSAVGTATFKSGTTASVPYRLRVMRDIPLPDEPTAHGLKSLEGEVDLPPLDLSDWEDFELALEDGRKIRLVALGGSAFGGPTKVKARDARALLEYHD